VKIRSCQAELDEVRFIRALLRLFVWHKKHGNAVDAVPGVFLGKAFAFKDVAEVATAVGANDFSAPPIGICHALDRTGYFIVERRPAAVRFKLTGGMVKRRAALPAHVGSGFFIVGVLAGERPLGAFVEDNVFFFGGEFAVGHDLLKQLCQGL